MQVALQASALKIREAALYGDWIVGTVAEPTSPSSKAPWFPPEKGLRGFIKRRSVTTGLAEFFYPPTQTGFLHRFSGDILANFLGIPFDEDNEMLDFLKKNGIFTETDLHFNQGFPSAVRRQWKMAQQAHAIPFALEVETLWQAKWEISMLNQLYASLGENNLEEVRDLCMAIGVGAEVTDGYAEQRRLDTGKAIRKEGWHLLGVVVGKNLMGARVVPVEQKGNLATWIATAFVRDTLFLHLMDRFTQGKPMKRCRNSRCPNDGGVFQPSRPDQQFCRDKCRLYVKRYRHLGISLDREPALLQAPFQRPRQQPRQQRRGNVASIDSYHD